MTDITEVLERWAELRNMLQETEPVEGSPSDPAIEMLRRCISELYDTLVKAEGFLESWNQEEEIWRAQEVEMYERIKELEAALKVTWIPCEERMPERRTLLWVKLLDWDNITIGRWSGGCWIMPLLAPRRRNLAVSHYAEIRWPEPPEWACRPVTGWWKER